MPGRQGLSSVRTVTLTHSEMRRTVTLCSWSMYSMRAPQASASCHPTVNGRPERTEGHEGDEGAVLR